MADPCSCGFGLFDTDADPFTYEWHLEHRRRHLAAFPDLVNEPYQGSLRNLTALILRAKEANRG